jgi:hypothetical protein
MKLILCAKEDELDSIRMVHNKTGTKKVFIDFEDVLIEIELEEIYLALEGGMPIFKNMIY